MHEHYQYINTPEALEAFCLRASEQPAIAVDTEFVRTRTFYPQLGLVQLYDGTDVVLVDVLAIDDCQPLIDLLVNPAVIKVLHAPSEDLEAFVHAFGVYPAPLFDTQIASHVMKIGNTLGYGRMVELLLEVTLEKGESRTDWLQRPLSSKQLAYAADDVLYLLPCYQHIIEHITPAQQQIVQDEIALMVDRKAAQMPPEYAYLGFKNLHKLRPLNLYVLQQLAAWRITYAREKDISLNFVTRELGLYEIARDLPMHKGALFQLELLAPQEARRHHQDYLRIVKAALEVSAEHYPQPPPRLADINGYKKRVADVKALCQPFCEQHGLDMAFVASKRQINQVISWFWHDMDETRAQGLTPELLTYWRGRALSDKIHSLFSS